MALGQGCKYTFPSIWLPQISILTLSNAIVWLAILGFSLVNDSCHLSMVKALDKFFLDPSHELVN